MHFLSIFATHQTILAGVVLLSLGVWVYIDGRRDGRAIALAALLVTASLWSFAHVLWGAAAAPGQVTFWARTVFFISTLLPVLFLFYAIASVTSELPRLWVQTSALATNAVLAWLIYGTNMTVAANGTGALSYGSGRTIIALHFGIFFLLGMGVLVHGSRSANAKRSERTFLSAGFGALIAFDPIFALLYTVTPAHTQVPFWVGNAALIIGMLVLTLSSVRRRLLVDIRLLGAELFVVSVISVIVIDIIVSDSLLDFTFRLVVLILLVIYGVLLSRSLVREALRLREIEQLNGEIMEANRKLVAADKLKTRSVSFAAHQLRTPLAGIKGYLSMMVDGDFGKMTEEQRSVLRSNLATIDKLDDTIETFLDYTKVELGLKRIERRDVTVKEAVQPVVERMRPMAMVKGLDIRVRYTGAREHVRIDDGKLYHVMSNLVDNAVKYSERGVIDVEAGKEGEEFFFRVTDKGKGMTDEELALVREVIRTGEDNVRFDEMGGSGIGMHVVRSIVLAHGGEVTAMSEGRGKGSTIGFRVPAD